MIFTLIIVLIISTRVELSDNIQLLTEHYTSKSVDFKHTKGINRSF